MNDPTSLLGASDFVGELAQQIREHSREAFELEQKNDDLKETIREFGSDLRQCHNGRHELERERDYYKRCLDTHEKEDAQAIALLRKARHTVNINPDGTRNLIDQAVTILNPPDDAPAPF